MARPPGPKQSTEPSNRIDPTGTSLLAAPETDVVPEALKVPGMAYQLVMKTEVHKYLRPKRIVVDGKMHTVPPWEVVKDDIPEEMRPRGSYAQGTAIDSAFQHGGLVLMTIPEQYVSLMQQATAQRTDLVERSIEKGAEERGEGARMRAGTTQNTSDIVPPYVRQVDHGGPFNEAQE